LGALFSPHEIRVEARLAIDQIKSWLMSEGVKFLQNSFATWTDEGGLLVNGKRVDFGHLVLAPGPDLRTIVPDWVKSHQVDICRLSMMRIRPTESFKLTSPVMSDLSLVRYRGYSELNSSSALLSRLKIEQDTHLEHGVHLIVVQSADGSLIVGDSHHYAPSIDPFVQEKTESLILEEMERVLNLKQYQIQERWVGYYPSAKKDAFIHECAQNVHLISVTSGTGMSTGFAIAAEWAEENL
jgi:FAD dependent oxidoreductase TIGR03364